MTRDFQANILAWICLEVGVCLEVFSAPHFQPNILAFYSGKERVRGIWLEVFGTRGKTSKQIGFGLLFGLICLEVGFV